MHPTYPLAQCKAHLRSSIDYPWVKEWINECMSEEEIWIWVSGFSSFLFCFYSFRWYLGGEKIQPAIHSHSWLIHLKIDTVTHFYFLRNFPFPIALFQESLHNVQAFSLQMVSFEFHTKNSLYESINMNEALLVDFPILGQSLPQIEPIWVNSAAINPLKLKVAIVNSRIKSKHTSVIIDSYLRHRQ